MFDAVEARANASIFKLLANATATPPLGDPFGIVFDPAGSVVNDIGVVEQRPMFEAPTTAVATLEEGMQVTIRSATYLVRQVLPLDEGLRQRVILAEA